MNRAAFDTALDAARACYDAIPALKAFVDWPDDLTFQRRAPHSLPLIPHLRADPATTSPVTTPLRDALVALCDHVEWRHTYTEAEVGADFLNRYGWFELAGPETGHYRSQTARLSVAYWGAGLHYPWHHHAAEEIYLVVAGEARFEAEGEAPRTLRAGETQFHRSNQPHAMTTGTSGLLAFVLWRGEALSAPPKMGRAA